MMRRKVEEFTLPPALFPVLDACGGSHNRHTQSPVVPRQRGHEAAIAAEVPRAAVRYAEHLRARAEQERMEAEALQARADRARAELARLEAQASAITAEVDRLAGAARESEGGSP